MKLQAIKRVCVARRKIEIRNAADGRQWIGSGDAWYPVDDNLRVTPDNLRGLFDLDDKAMEKIEVREIGPGADDYRYRLESVEGESARQMERYVTLYGINGLCRMLVCQDDENEPVRGVAIVDVDLIKPAETKDGYMEYRLRPAGAGTAPYPLIACYNSLMCGALIRPWTRGMTAQALDKMRAALLMDAAGALEDDGGAEADGEAAEKAAENQMRMDMDEMDEEE